MLRGRKGGLQQKITYLGLSLLNFHEAEKVGFYTLRFAAALLEFREILEPREEAPK